MSRWRAFEALNDWLAKSQNDPDASLTLAREQVEAIWWELLRGYTRDEAARSYEEQDEAALAAFRAHKGAERLRAAASAKGWLKDPELQKGAMVLEYLCLLHGVPPRKKHTPAQAVRAIAESEGYQTTEAARKALHRARKAIREKPDGVIAAGPRPFFSREAILDFPLPYGKG